MKKKFLGLSGIVLVGFLTVFPLLSAQAGALLDKLRGVSEEEVMAEDRESSSLFSSGKEALFKGGRMLRDVSYGPNERQKLDVYLPPHPASAPILVMVHGGAWMIGDKGHSGVVKNKGNYFQSKGFIFVSVNYRLLPEADPLTQAQDVALALAKIQKESRSWGGDSTRLVLMGHSAGAHLVALLSAKPTLAAKAGAEPWRGTVVLDSAAMDVPGLMANKGHAKFYDRAFGDDKAYWEQVSPLHQLSSRALPMLLVCSSKRAESCGAANQFMSAARQQGVNVSVHTEKLTHGDINKQLGLPGDYTRRVETFIKGIL